MIILVFLIHLGIFLAQNENISRENFCVACNKVEAQQIASMGYVSQWSIPRVCYSSAWEWD